MNARTSHPTHPNTEAAGRTTLATDHNNREDHDVYVGGDYLVPTSSGPQPIYAASGQPSRQPIPRSKPSDDPAGDLLGDDQMSFAPQLIGVVAKPSATDPDVHETQRRSVGGGTPWHELRAWAEQFAAVQQFRIAAENKVRSANVDAGMFDAQLASYNQLEHMTDLAMGRTYRRIVPVEIKEWQKAHPGIGVHLLALLLGHLGNPSVATPAHWEGTGAARVLIHDDPRPRTLGQLWSYCGIGDPTQRKAKGMTAEELAALGNPQLKMLLYLLATKCMMARTVHGGRYGEIYDLRRLLTADRLHATDCVRCGPSGKPALAGSPWSKAHQHADALRIVGKEILRDLWLIARAAR